MADSPHKLIEGLVRKAPVVERRDEDCTGPKSLRWKGGGCESVDRRTV